MRDIFAQNLPDMLKALNLFPIGVMPKDQETTNQLLLQMLIMQKIGIAANNVGIDWTPYEVWVEQGATPTMLVPVQRGDLVVARVMNHDEDNSSVVYLEQNSTVTPSDNIGLEFPVTTIVLGVNDTFDMNEGGPNFAVVMTAGTYATGAAFAAQLTLDINAAGLANVYLVRWDDAAKLFQITTTNVGAIQFWVTPATGPNTAISVARLAMGWLADAVSVLNAGTWGAWSDTEHTNTITPGDRFLHGHPIAGGEETVVVLTDSLYGVQKATSLLRAKMSVMLNRIVTRNR